MNKLIIMIMGQNCQDTIGMCLDSAMGADRIIYLDGGSTDNTLKEVKERLSKKDILFNKWDDSDLEMNGKQRNFYLDYLKKNHLDDWCLVMDADEVLEDRGITKLRILIERYPEPALVSPRIHHFIGDLGHEDATKNIHFVPNRIFKIIKDLEYPLGQHPVLKGNLPHGTVDIHLWHFRECLGVFSTFNKHITNWNKSEIHDKHYLDWWHKSMLFGNYPRKQVYYGEIPLVIKERFLI